MSIKSKFVTAAAALALIGGIGGPVLAHQLWSAAQGVLPAAAAH